MEKSTENIWRVTGIMLLFVFMVSCTKPEDRPNIVLITLDTTRADRLGCYGYEDAVTPHLDRLADEGVLYERAYSCVPLTLPAHASMLTGLYPPEHGLRVNGQGALSSSFTTVVERLSARGYQTAAIVASKVLDKKYNLNQGFDYYNDNINPDSSSYQGLRAYRPADQVSESFMSWYDAKKKGPYFVWLHFFDPHKPYHNHKRQFGDAFDNAYDAEIAYMDYYIGRVLSRIAADEDYEDVRIIVVGDHGEGLGDHGELYHGNYVYNSTLHVPLITRNVEIQTDAGTPVSIKDIYSFVMAAAGEPVERVHSDDERLIYAETMEPLYQYGWSPLYAGIEADWKYIQTPETELYNLGTDFSEQTNLFLYHKQIAVVISNRLNTYRFEMHTAESEPVSLSSEDVRNLQSLGYSAGGYQTDIHDDAADLADVKNMMPLLNMAMKSKGLVDAGQYAEALRLRKQLYQSDSRNPMFTFLLAESYYYSGEFTSCATLLETMLEQQSEQLNRVLLLDVITLLGASCMQAGDIQAAYESFEAAIDVDPTSATALNGLAWLHVYDRTSCYYHPETAKVLAQQAVKLTGTNVYAPIDTLALAYKHLNKNQTAIEWWERALTVAEKNRHESAAEKIRNQIAELQSR